MFHRKYHVIFFYLKIMFLYVKGSSAVQKLQVLFCVLVVISTEFWVKYAVTLVLKASYLWQQREDRLANRSISSLTCTTQVWHHHKYTLQLKAGIIMVGIQEWVVWDWLTQKWNNVQYACHRYYVSIIRLENVINIASQVNLCG